ncbi:MAG: PHP domain-containing protein [Gemmataceae bacterium]
MPSPLRATIVVLTTLATFTAVVAWQRPSAPETPPGILPVLRSGKSNWYRGNLHTHSLWSDGDDFPEMIADWYKRNGYHFLALTEHNLLADGERWLTITAKSTRPLALSRYRDRFGSTWVEERPGKEDKQVRLKPLAEFRSLLEEPGRFLMIPSEEITHQFSKLPVHMNAINLRDAIKPVDGPGVTETISVNHRLTAEQARRLKRPILTFLNHPNFGWGVTGEQMALAPELRYFEVYNGHPGVRNEGDATHASCERLWDIVLSLRLGKHGLDPVRAVATDDAHGYLSFGPGKVNPGRGWVMVRSPYLTPEAIVRAMEAGDYYCSTGVVLDELQCGPTEIALTIKPEPGVSYRTEFIATLRDVPLTANPVLGRDGEPLPVTQHYSDEVGKVVARSDELSPRYRLTGQERYVRARIVSTRKHPNPYRKGDVEMAWTQPVLPRQSP